MAFLSAPVRWPDVISIDVSFDGIAAPVRPYLPGPLKALPSAIIASAFLSWTLIISITVFSFVLNQRRRSLVPARPHLAATPPKRRRAGGQTSLTLLVGPEQTGKSTLYSALVFDAIPETQTSQHENKSLIAVKGQANVSATQIRLVDLPGHPRLRTKANDFLARADKIVFCVDTASAIKGGTTKNDALIDAVDHFHATLTSLARSRLSRSVSSKAFFAPSLLILFTRGDLSPLLSSSPYDTKRQAQVITRARAAFESELGRRRAGMGLGRGARGARTKVAGMGKVVGGSSTLSSQGWLASLKALLGLGTSRSPTGIDDEENDEDEDQEILDYVDWAWSQRAAASDTSSSASGNAVAMTTSAFSLDKLDEEVISGGKAHFAVASLGKERGWDIVRGEADSNHNDDGSNGGSRLEGLKELREWLAAEDDGS